MTAGSGAARTAVRHGDDLPAPSDGAVRRSVLVAPDEGSALGLERIELAAGARTALPDPDTDDLLVYVVAGSGDGPASLEPGDAFLSRGDERAATIRAGETGLVLMLARAGERCDEHAALGERTAVSHLDVGGGEDATGHRSFQVLLGPGNGCCRATMFVGVVPPGAAPWHFHQYDEIICILSGGGAFHQARGAEPTRPGSVVRIPPRTVHINENAGSDPMAVLGVFTPAGSPSAAYLAADPR